MRGGGGDGKVEMRANAVESGEDKSVEIFSSRRRHTRYWRDWSSDVCSSDLPYVNVSESFTRFVVGLSAPESARLLTYLFDLINRPDFHMRVRWQPGMIVIWEDRKSVV